MRTVDMHVGRSAPAFANIRYGYVAGMVDLVERGVRKPWRAIFSSKVLTLNGLVAFALPRTVTALGVSLLMGLAGLHAYVWATRPALPRYYLVYSVVLIAACLIAAVALVVGINPSVPQAGWYFGDAVCLAFLAIYLVTRAVRLQGLVALTARWDVAPGTFAMVFAAGFVAVHTTVLAGINVVYPQHRHWYA